MSSAYQEAIKAMAPRQVVRVHATFERGAPDAQTWIDAGPPPVDVIYRDGELHLVGMAIDYRLERVQSFNIRHVEI